MRRPKPDPTIQVPTGRRAEPRGLSRRSLLGSTSALAAATALGTRAQARPAGGTRPTLIQVFLRGAMDGLTTVVPYGDAELYSWRPTLAIQPPGNPDGALDLDGFFGLAPAAAPLQTPFQAGHLAIVHASGSIDPTRSHFDAFVRMEFGDPNLPLGLVQNGWLTRTLEQTTGSGPLRAISAADLLPYALSGAAQALPIPDFAQFVFPGRPQSAGARVAAIVDTHARRGAPVGPAGLGTIDSIALLGTIDFAGYVPANGAQYPASTLGLRLRNTAALIKANVGVEVITLDVDGWDLHASLGPITGAMAGLLDDLTRSLEAFYLDLLGHLNEYVLVCLSEFGRRVEENASAGTDHGHGNALFVMGGGVNGGEVHGTWPGLALADLDQGDLAITTDYRDVLGEILDRRLGLDPTTIFPQHVFQSVGVLA